MTRNKLIAATLAVVVVAVVISLASPGRDDEQLAALLPQSAAPIAESSRSPTAPSMKRLTDRVIADDGVLVNAWVVRPIELLGPRIRLPAEPTAEGTLSEADTPFSEATASPDPGYVGADACAECHQVRFEGFTATAHYQTSKPCEAEAIRGPLTPPGNRAVCSEERLSFEMRERGDQISQIVKLEDWSLSLPMDVIVGSGKLAQTFLYWHGDALYQSHVSYFTELGMWKASPGLNDFDTDYARPIQAGCLECHVTYIDKKTSPNHYRAGSLVWGISCERCHGPGKAHIEYHRAAPQSREAKFITNPAALPRQRQLDLCGQCHLGEFRLRGRPFEYRPGDRIEEFHELVAMEGDGDGVHTSDQLKRLRLSECFQQSEMTCVSCHNPHLNQRGDLIAFSQACLKCHEIESCGSEPLEGVPLAHDCISCHMPRVRNIDLRDVAPAGADISAVDHYIRVNPASNDD